MERTWKLNVRHSYEMTFLFFENGWTWVASKFYFSKFQISSNKKIKEVSPWSRRAPQEIRGQNGSPGGLGFKIATLTQPTTLPSKLNIIPSDFFEAWLVRFVSQLEPGSCNHNFNASSGTTPAESETSPSLHHGPPNQPWPPPWRWSFSYDPWKKASKKLQTRNFHEISWDFKVRKMTNITQLDPNWVVDTWLLGNLWWYLWCVDLILAPGQTTRPMTHHSSLLKMVGNPLLVLQACSTYFLAHFAQVEFGMCHTFWCAPRLSPFLHFLRVVGWERKPKVTVVDEAHIPLTCSI